RLPLRIDILKVFKPLALLSSPVKLEDSLTGETTAQINCAYAFVAGVCLCSRQSNFKVKSL
ncbi:MAG: hypothetical protein ACLU98_14085, partial [Desulfovibrio fairfieldensis]